MEVKTIQNKVFKFLLVFIAILIPFFLFGNLEWETKSIYYKATLYEKEMSAVFPFKNSGDTKIRIIEISSSCGCTVVKKPKVLYKPGERDRITATFTFGERVGRHTKFIEVKYGNDISTHSDRLTINAQIPEKIRITPRLLRWKFTKPAIQNQVQIFVSPALGYRLRGVSSIRDGVNTSIETIDNSGNYIIKIHPGILSSTERFVVNVEFFNSHNEIISFPILCVVS